MTRKNITPFLFAILAMTLGIATVASAAGGVGGRPANPDPDNPRTQSIFIYTLNGGETKADQLYLSNSDSTTQTVLLYAVDGTVTNTGAFTCRQEVEPRTDIGKAITLAKNEVTLPANGNTLVDFTLTLPKNADVGEHDGCIVIQRKGDEGQQTGSIRLKTRTAVRVAAMVPGDIHREIQITEFDAGQLIKDSDLASHISHTVAPWGTLRITFGLKNTGNVSADVDARAVVSDLFGNEVSRSGGQYAVIASTTFGANFDSDFHPIFGGWYKVKATSAYDKRAGVFGVTDQSQLVRSQTPEIIVFMWPSLWVLIPLTLLIIGGVVFLIWRRRQAKVVAPRRARAALKKPSDQTMWGAYEVQPGDTLEALAEGSGVEINKIAILNKLYPPYTLTVGQKIYLPRRK